MKIDIADLDVIYLSFDEPQCENFWARIQNMIPWAQRVHGVIGSDAAHKAAAECSTTDRFILIDGDNMPNIEFFDLQLDFTDLDQSYQRAQFRWKAVNNINGLRYGNGGMSCWTKEYVANMRTHEASDGNDKTTVDFCLDSNDDLYWSMHDCYSTTYPNYSAFQAWRAGFREGVKMCLAHGRLPELQQFKDNLASRNLDNLTVWHNVGLDVENGEWAIYGSRLGTYMTLLTQWDSKQVQSFEYLKQLWSEHSSLDPHTEADKIGDVLHRKLELPICTLSGDQSAFFKRHCNNTHYNMGPLVKEMDVIRRLEGW